MLKGTTPTPWPQVLVFGGGISGMAFALGLARSGVTARLLEKRSQMGGMSAVWQEDGVRLHPGVHLLHASTDELRPTLLEMKHLMGDDCLVVTTTSALHFLDRYLAFPLRTRELLPALGPRKLAQVVLSAAAARLESQRLHLAGRQTEDSFDAVVASAFGRSFYSLFFKDYTAKVLGMDPKQISGEWARRRVPMPSRNDLLQRLFPFYRPRKVEHPHPTFPVGQLTGKEGLDSLFAGIASQMSPMVTPQTETCLESIEVRSGAVRSVTLRKAGHNPETLHANNSSMPIVASSIPLPELVTRLSGDIPDHVRSNAALLKYRSLIYVFVEIHRPWLHKTQWTYFQSPHLLFNRLSEFSNIVPMAYGPNRTVVCAEISAQPGDEWWAAPERELVRITKQHLQSVVPGLKPEAFGRSWVRSEEHAYPVYDMGFQLARSVVLAFVDSINGLVTLGRQGRFDYLNMDECYRMSFDSASKLAKNIAQSRS